MGGTQIEKFAKEFSDSVSLLSKGTTYGTLIFGIIMSTIINELLSTYLPLQLSLHFPILNVWIPPVIMTQFRNFVPIVNFDLMSELRFYTDFLDSIS